MESTEIIYKKSLWFAKWSYIGALVPIVGIILAMISNQLRDMLTPNTYEEKEGLERLRRIAHWGMMVSLWPLWLFIIGLIVALITGIFAQQ